MTDAAERGECIIERVTNVLAPLLTLSTGVSPTDECYLFHAVPYIFGSRRSNASSDALYRAGKDCMEQMMLICEKFSRGEYRVTFYPCIYLCIVTGK